MIKQDLRGAARLAAEATVGLTDLVEAMHERIARLPGVKNTGVEGRTTGITGLVYRSVRGVTRLVGGSVDAVLSLLAPLLGDALSGPEREAVVAALNGVLGDHLAATHWPPRCGCAAVVCRWCWSGKRCKCCKCSLPMPVARC
jgi:hypothetical protein